MRATESQISEIFRLVNNYVEKHKCRANIKIEQNNITITFIKKWMMLSIKKTISDVDPKFLIHKICNHTLCS